MAAIFSGAYPFKLALTCAMMRPWGLYPNHWFCKLDRVRAIIPAPASKISETDACSTTKDRCGRELFAAAERPAPRKTMAGSVRDTDQAGATPNTTPVTSESRKAKPNTGSEGA